MDSTDPAEPTLPTEAIDPTLPMDSTEPRDPIDSTESVDHNDSRDDPVEAMGALCRTPVAPEGRSDPAGRYAGTAPG